MSDVMPSVGSRAIHKDTPTGKGPVWEVTKHDTSVDPAVVIDHANHRVNQAEGFTGGAAKKVPVRQFNSDYKLL